MTLWRASKLISLLDTMLPEAQWACYPQSRAQIIQNLGTILLNLELRMVSLDLVFHGLVKLNHVHNLVHHSHEIKRYFVASPGLCI